VLALVNESEQATHFPHARLPGSLVGCYRSALGGA
jgi:hypothetical protein